MTVTIEIPDAFIARAKAAGDDPVALVNKTLADLYASSAPEDRLPLVEDDSMTDYERQRIATGLARIDAGIPGVPWKIVLAKLEKNAGKASR